MGYRALHIDTIILLKKLVLKRLLISDPGEDTVQSGFRSPRRQSSLS